MRNMTITIDERTAEWARVLAAKNHTSVSRLVGELLAEKMRNEEGYIAAMNSYRLGGSAPLSDGPYPARDTLHER